MTKYMKKILRTFTRFRSETLRSYMFSSAQRSSQGRSVNPECVLSECSLCCNFTCWREDASCRESDCLVVYNTGPYGFVWASLPAPAGSFLATSGVCSGAATSRTHRCRWTRDSPGRQWDRAAHEPQSRSTREASPCLWMRQLSQAPRPPARAFAEGWCEAGGSRVTVVPEGLCTRQWPRPASRSRLTSQNPVQLVTIMVRPRDFKMKQEAF